MNRIYEYRRHLPHFQSDYKAIFVTFSTHHRWILPPEARTITLQACLWGNGKLFTLHGVVIMPDHAHLVLTPCTTEAASTAFLRSCKASKACQRTGSIAR